MRKSNIRGSFGEGYVCDYLTERGYKLAARNYRIRGAEIDIIALKDRTLVFVEVKTRKAFGVSDGTETAGADKQKRIAAAAQRFVETNTIDFDNIRFDAAFLTVTSEDSPRVLELEYVENAFEA